MEVRVLIKSNIDKIEKVLLLIIVNANYSDIMAKFRTKVTTNLFVFV